MRLSRAADNFILLWTRISRLISSSEPGAHAMITYDHAFFLLFCSRDKKGRAPFSLTLVILRSSCQLFSPSRKTIIMVSFAIPTIFGEIKGPYVLRNTQISSFAPSFAPVPRLASSSILSGLGSRQENACKRSWNVREWRLLALQQPSLILFSAYNRRHDTTNTGTVGMSGIRQVAWGHK